MKVLITGGAGFIGANLAHRLLRRQDSVTVFDNLARKGTNANLEWLCQQHGDRLRFVEGDVRDFATLLAATRGAEVVYHLAGQVAVTTSVADPRTDFEVNALGTFNALEAARQAGDDPVFLYSSTNKVYGGMEETAIVEDATRYVYKELPFGVPETQPLDFHSPYGCSKGAGDQYVRDYARIYGLRTVVFRQSCVYGYRQFGVEDQGWVAWFTIAAVLGRPITIYGTGRQVRDVLFVDDLLDVYDAAVQRIDVAKGQVYNIGGGPRHTLAVWSEFAPLLSAQVGRPIDCSYADWRPGDQLVYVSDIRKAQRELGWQPRTGVGEGLSLLHGWVEANRGMFE
jgi:CDP-paratose 2-epimerase